MDAADDMRVSDGLSSFTTTSHHTGFQRRLGVLPPMTARETGLQPATSARHCVLRPPPPAPWSVVPVSRLGRRLRCEATHTSREVSGALTRTHSLARPHRRWEKA